VASNAVERPKNPDGVMNSRKKPKISQPEKLHTQFALLLALYRPDPHPHREIERKERGYRVHSSLVTKRVTRVELLEK
jgi:hypothetical protein